MGFGHLGGESLGFDPLIAQNQGFSWLVFYFKLVFEVVVVKFWGSCGLSLAFF